MIRAENEADSLSEALAAARREREELAEERARLLAVLDERQGQLDEISAAPPRGPRIRRVGARKGRAVPGAERSRRRAGSPGGRIGPEPPRRGRRVHPRGRSRTGAGGCAEREAGAHKKSCRRPARKRTASRTNASVSRASWTRFAGIMPRGRRRSTRRCGICGAKRTPLRAARDAERRALAEECAGLAADLAARRREVSNLSGRQQELERALSETANGRAALADDLERLRDEKTDAEAERGRLVEDLAQAQRDRHALALQRDRLAAELDGQRRLAAEQAASAERSHGAEAQALQTRLVDAEAALSHATTKRTRGGLLPGLWRTTMARKLVRSGLLDPEWYVAIYPDVAESGLRPAAHYLEIGFARGYKPNPFFDTRFYLQENEDVRRAGLNPALHYLLHGWREGRDPSREFSTDYYLTENPDVRTSGRNPLSHYLQDGRHEGRLAHPEFLPAT